MRLIVLRRVEKELREAPREVLADIFSLFDELMAGRKLSLPISRPLPDIAKGLHELRLSGRFGEFRVFYLIRTEEAIYVLHATLKKSRKIERKTVELLKARIKGL